MLTLDAPSVDRPSRPEALVAGRRLNHCQGGGLGKWAERSLERSNEINKWERNRCLRSLYSAKLGAGCCHSSLDHHSNCLCFQQKQCPVAEWLPHNFFFWIKAKQSQTKPLKTKPKNPNVNPKPKKKKKNLKKPNTVL